MDCKNHAYHSSMHMRLAKYPTIEHRQFPVKFKCKLSNTVNMFQSSYEIAVTGMTAGSVPPEDIISIEIIAGFNQMQEKYAEYNGLPTATFPCSTGRGSERTTSLNG